MNDQQTIILSHYDLDHFMAAAFYSPFSIKTSLAFSYWIIPDPSKFVFLYQKGKNAGQPKPFSPSALSLLGFLLGSHKAKTYILNIDIPVGRITSQLSMDYGIGNDGNDRSIVCSVDVGGHRCILPGDAQYSCWPLSISTKPFDFFIVPHHGSVYASTIPNGLIAHGTKCFLTCSENNTYGHPSEQHLSALVSSGVTSLYRFQLHRSIALQCYTSSGARVLDRFSIPVSCCCWAYP